MSIALFAIIGATIKAGTWYWICFGVYALAKIKQLVENVIYDGLAEEAEEQILDYLNGGYRKERRDTK